MGPYDLGSQRLPPPLERQIDDLSTRVDKNRKDFDELVESLKKFQEELEVTWKDVLSRFLEQGVKATKLEERVLKLEREEEE